MGQVSCESPNRPTLGPFPPIHASGGVPRSFPVLIRTQQTEEATVMSKNNQRFLPGKEPQALMSGSERHHRPPSPTPPGCPGKSTPS